MRFIRVCVCVCVCWCRWMFPFIGHMGICTSAGVIRDFAGPYFVSVSQSAPSWIVVAVVVAVVIVIVVIVVKGSGGRTSFNSSLTPAFVWCLMSLCVCVCVCVWVGHTFVGNESLVITVPSLYKPISLCCCRLFCVSHHTCMLLNNFNLN